MFSFPAKPTPAIKACMVASWIIVMLYVLGLPYWSYLFNDVLGYWKGLCRTPAEHITCNNVNVPFNASYLEIARKLNRSTDGQLYGCTCGEGVFADWACLSSSETPFAIFRSNTYSISYFISTPSATGGLAATAFWPIFFIWWYGVGTTSPNQLMQMNPSLAKDEAFIAADLALVRNTQIVFQIFFNLFLFNTLCMFPSAHGVVVALFIIAEIIHFIAIAKLYGYSSVIGKLITGLCMSGVWVLAIGNALSSLDIFNGTSIQLYSFWLAECYGFAAIFAITPLLVFLRPDLDDSATENDP
jgi:hypothetical protein